MAQDDLYKDQIFNWLESVIKCELPTNSEVIVEQPGCPLKKPSLSVNELDPRIAEGPNLGDDDSDFAEQFQQFVTELAVHCNWHEHTETCWKHLQNNKPRDDHHCRMRMNGTTRAFIDIDPETQSILLWRLHPRINNFNDVVLFLLHYNMDIKYIESGQAAKALVDYVTDYIIKSFFPVHVGFDALRYAIKQNSVKFTEDSNSSPKEKSRSLFTKCVNAIIACQELSHQQVMSYLVGGGDCYKSHTFQILRWGQFNRYIQSQQRDSEDLPSHSVDQDIDATIAESSDSDGKNDEHPVLLPSTNDSLELHEEVLLSLDGDRFSVHSNLQDYQWRSPEPTFGKLSLWEYTEYAHKILLAAENARLARLSERTG
ncbi:hypothetical protein SERLADRAFT_432334 [Serpula lacrymans var. lacrymans S7.9]|nr:uncharacterized protein SERLADRAFT_432334 [Serpula lacrymans var. lacrymans S7.9]EGO30716.1 hypothetical protein SERLADRAFT_432334 [Serpula lacrymans var. lacrymans S7.9]